MFTLVDIIVTGGLVMIPLLFCSVIAFAVVIERAMFWRRIGAHERFENLFDAVETTTSPERGKLWLLLTLRPKPWVAAQGQIPFLRKRLTILDPVITLAPLLGLLGTVVGMIGSFEIMSASGIGQPHAVTGGVAEALIATATGLLIATLTLLTTIFPIASSGSGTDRVLRSRLELLLGEVKDKS